MRPLLPVPTWLQGRGGQPEGYCHRQLLDAVKAAFVSSTEEKAPARQDVVANDVHLALDPALTLRPVSRQHVDVVAVVASECDRFRMQRDCLARGGVPTHDRLGAVIDDAQRHPCEVRERLAVAVARSWLVVKQQNGSR